MLDSQQLISRARTSLLFLLALWPGLAVVAGNTAHALEPQSCSALWSEVPEGFGLDGTGTIVGKTIANWTAVQHLTSARFDAATWEPSVRATGAFFLNQEDGNHFRGTVQAIQTYARDESPAKGSFDFWFSKSGTFYSRSPAWNSPWTAWTNVECFRAPSFAGQRRIIVRGYIPDEGWFITLDLRDVNITVD